LRLAIEAPQHMRASLRPGHIDFLMSVPSARQSMMVAARHDNGLRARLPAASGARPWHATSPA